MHPFNNWVPADKIEIKLPNNNGLEHWTLVQKFECSAYFYQCIIAVNVHFTKFLAW